VQRVQRVDDPGVVLRDPMGCEELLPPGTYWLRRAGKRVQHDHRELRPINDLLPAPAPVSGSRPLAPRISRRASVRLE
jgi:hypothetical protein